MVSDRTRLLCKKVSRTSRLLVSSTKWMHVVPTQDCDVLVTFPANTNDQVLMWFLSLLKERAPELLVQVHRHSNTSVYGLYFTAIYNSMLHAAEELAIRKPIKTEFGGGMKEFIYEDLSIFQGVEEASTFFSSQERQCIVKHMLYNIRAKDKDEIANIKFLEGQAIIPHLLSKGIAEQIFPLHSMEDLTILRESWVKAVYKPQPLGRICDYFGVKIAMYFAYLGHYTWALTLPSFLGIILWFTEGTSQFLDDVSFVAFACFNVLWATVYLENWKRRSSELAYLWGTLDKEDELITEPRPLFHGYNIRSPVTGRMEPYYPAWKRNLFRYFVSIPVIMSCLCVVFAIMWCIFELQDWVNLKIKAGDLPFFTKFMPKVLLALSIGVLDDIYKKIAYWLNDKENYRLDSTYENNLIIKLVLFQFVNSFLSLFYIAFYLRDMDRLKDQLATLLITRQVIGNIKEALLPFLFDRAKLIKIASNLDDSLENEAKARENDESKHATSGKVMGGKQNEDAAEGGEYKQIVDEDSSKGLCRQRHVREDDTGSSGSENDVTHVISPFIQAEVEASQKAYEDTFEDYLEMFIQFGYVTLFSSAFPCAALCGLLNNIIEIRSDAFKLCMTYQRPFGQRVENIGIWQDALEVMSIIAVIVNCALIGMSGLASRLFPEWGSVERIIFIVALEHIVLVLKFLLAYAIPDQPTWIVEEKARLEFLRREALKKLHLKESSNRQQLSTCQQTSS